MTRSRSLEAAQRLSARFTYQRWQRIFASGGTLADSAEMLEAIPAHRIWIMAEADRAETLVEIPARRVWVMAETDT